MKQKEKSALSRQRILDAAMEEFSQKGYEGASLSAVWAKKGLSKGIVYHHFKDRDALYLSCVGICFEAACAYLREAADSLSGSPYTRLQDYFDARLRFFAENPLYLGIFTDAVFSPPEKLRSEISTLRQEFDALNIAVLSDLLKSQPLRPGLSADTLVSDFRMYMDYFNMRFGTDSSRGRPARDLLKEHEEKCHRHLDILLYGVLERGERK
ncbi:MAG: TetR/AcrR family transcriptional regulator [Emergencia sp.]